MITKNSNLFKRVGLLSVLLFGVTISLTPAYAEEEGKLEGTWLNQVTVHICQTGTVLFGFPSLDTYAQGGTMTETTAGAPLSLLSPGHGKWEKTGSHTYTATFVSFTFDATGTWTGTQKLTLLIRVVGDDNAFTSTSQVFNTAGQLVGGGCASAVGHRM